MKSVKVSSLKKLGKKHRKVKEELVIKTEGDNIENEGEGTKEYHESDEISSNDSDKQSGEAYSDEEFREKLDII